MIDAEAAGFSAIRPGLTAVIVNYRTAGLVIECVDHLKEYPPALLHLAIMVVDNGSGDGSLERIGAAHPDITLVDACCNLGFARGNNLALRMVDTEFALLINSDALVERGTLDMLVDALRADPTVGVVGPRVVNMDDGADQDYPYRFPSVVEMLRRAVAGPQYPARDRHAPLEVDRVHGACLMTRAEVLRQVGLLDEGFFMYDEDVDWCLRVRKAGWRLLLLPQVAVRHYGGASSDRKPSGRRRHSVPSEGSLRMRYELRRSRYRLYRKHRGAIETLLLKLLTDVALLADSALWIVQGKLSAEGRRATAAILRCNLRIIRLNPFGAQMAP